MLTVYHLVKTIMRLNYVCGSCTNMENMQKKGTLTYKDCDFPIFVFYLFIFIVGIFHFIVK